MSIRVLLALALAAYICHLRVAVAPGVTAPALAVLLALICVATAALVAVIVHSLAREARRARPRPRHAG